MIGCSSVKSNNKSFACDSVSAKAIADKQMKRKGFKLSGYTAKVEEGTNYFLIKYTSLQQYTTGGGGEIKIDKGNCHIIDKLFYQ